MPGKTTRADDGDLPTAEEIAACRRCELWEQATQGVAGEGGSGARVMLVGEQPGNDEDFAGRPFVGPAGLLLRALIEEAGLSATQIYITNAVKHFYFQLRGKRRIHRTPLQRHVAACHEWLERELAQVNPDVIVALGGTALAAILGRRLAIGEARGRALHLPSGTPVVATYHPSAVLRAPDEASRVKLRATLLADLKRAGRITGQGEP
jgi:uracil-DNA glycosylase